MNLVTQGLGKPGGLIASYGYGARPGTGIRLPVKAILLIGADPRLRALIGALAALRILIGRKEPC